MRNAVSGTILAVIIVLTAGLLFRGVAKTREAAARMACGNNLHQFAISVHNYESTYERFPQAAHLNPSLPTERRLSWVIEIVPYIQSDPLYSRLKLDKGWDADENRFAALVAWKTFQCPAYPDRPPDTTFGQLHLPGIAGIGSDAADLPIDDPRAGFFGYDRKLTFANISSSTLLLAVETSRATGAWTAAGPPTVRGLVEGTPYLGLDGQFGGNHAGTTNAVFADGRVRRFRDSMDPGVLEAIMTIKGSKGVESLDEQ